jgi:hypothetical protein
VFSLIKTLQKYPLPLSPDPFSNNHQVLLICNSFFLRIIISSYPFLLNFWLAHINCTDLKDISVLFRCMSIICNDQIIVINITITSNFIISLYCECTIDYYIINCKLYSPYGATYSYNLFLLSVFCFPPSTLSLWPLPDTQFLTCPVFIHSIFWNVTVWRLSQFFNGTTVTSENLYLQQISSPIGKNKTVAFLPLKEAMSVFSTFEFKTFWFGMKVCSSPRDFLSFQFSLLVRAFSHSYTLIFPAAWGLLTPLCMLFQQEYPLPVTYHANSL